MRIKGRASSDSVRSGAGVTPTSTVPRVGSQDWLRLESERETTAAALSAALQRVASLEREAEELKRERAAAERNSQGEIGGLRAALRRLAAPTLRAARRRLGAASGSSSGSRASMRSGGPSSEQTLLLSGDESRAISSSLLQHRIKDLERTAENLRIEVHRARTSETVLKQSISARSSALRMLLLRGALGNIEMPPQCGPFKMQVSQAAELEALRCAVEDQLRINLRLGGSGGLDGSS